MIKEIYHFLAVREGLSSSGQPTEAQLSGLAGEGVELIINLALHDDPRYSLADEAASVRSLGMAYIHIPVQFDRPLKSDLAAFFNALQSNQDKKIHVHCAANMRVTVFLGLYFLIREGRSDAEAFKPMREIWTPDPVWSSFIDAMISEFSD